MTSIVQRHSYRQPFLPFSSIYVLIYGVLCAQKWKKIGFVTFFLEFYAEKVKTEKKKKCVCNTLWGGSSESMYLKLMYSGGGYLHSHLTSVHACVHRTHSTIEYHRCVSSSRTKPLPMSASSRLHHIPATFYLSMIRCAHSIIMTMIYYHFRD